MRNTVILFLILSSMTFVNARPNTKLLWTSLLRSAVSEGTIDGVTLNVVDYQRLQRSGGFGKLIEGLKTFDPSTLKSREEKMAFWINAYNIAAAKLIVENYPVESVRDIGTVFSPVWKKPAIIIGGQTYSLDQIENDILRPMGDPRIHFAIVCASVSCPDLRPEAYDADILDQQLDDQTRKFFQNPMKGFRLAGDQKSAYVSSILKWFKKDFGNVRLFISKYANVNANELKIKYLPYNWKLNGK